jgi:putative tryptophan/tyrosine transport system substrate-binding protein
MCASVVRTSKQKIGAAPIRTSILIVVLTMLAALPLLADAQPAGKAPKIAFLSASSPINATVEAFRQGLRDLGYIEGRNIVIEYRWAEGRFDRLPALAAELLRLGVTVIVAGNTPAALAAKKATSTIPIILVTSGDPVGSGLAASLARPGGNVTGLSLTPTPAISGKQLELLKEAFPSITHVAVLANPANPPTAGLLKEIELAAQSLGLRLRVVQVQEPKEFGDAFATMKNERVPALLVIADPLVADNRDRIVAFAATNRLPAIYPYRLFVDAGGLMSYGADSSDLYRRAATYVDRILKGAKPAELPIEQPTKFELVINMRTARALGLSIPRQLLVRADRVIE